MLISSNETKLTGDEAIGCYGRVASFDGDYSLHALFRAIVINHDDCSTAKTLKTKSHILQNSVRTRNDIVYVIKQYDAPMVILSFEGDFNDAQLSLDGWETFDNAPYYLNRYLSQVTRTKVYINRESRRVLALVDKHVKNAWIQAFSSMLWVVLPWYYPEKDDEVIKFFKSISINNKTVTADEAKQNLIDYVNKAAEKINFRDLVLHTMLDGIADSHRKSQMETHQTLIQSLQRRIRDTNDNLARDYSQLADELLALHSLEITPVTEDHAMYDFFSCHKNITVDNVDGAWIHYGVVDTLEFYDEDEAKSLFDNENSWVHDFEPSFMATLRTLLIEKRGIIKVCANFRLVEMKLVSPLKGEYPNNGGMPNPHIYYYACSGGNDQYYAKYAEQGAWDLAIEQSISATKNWSVGDSVVGSRMFRWLRDNANTPCIYMTDGSPIDMVTDECSLVSFNKYTEIVSQKLAEEYKEQKSVSENESEEVENG